MSLILGGAIPDVEIGCGVADFTHKFHYPVPDLFGADVVGKVGGGPVGNLLGELLGLIRFEAGSLSYPGDFFRRERFTAAVALSNRNLVGRGSVGHSTELLYNRKACDCLSWLNTIGTGRGRSRSCGSCLSI